MIYRSAILSDVEDIIELHKESFPGEYANAANQVENKNHRVYVACEEKIHAYIIYQAIEGEAEVYFFAVKEEYRNNGIGEKLFEFSVNELIKEKFHKISLEVRESNIAARKIYEKCGFKNVGVRIRYYTDNMEDAIIYVLEG